MLQKLNHRNIIKVYDHHKGTLFLEHASNGDLIDFLINFGTLPTEVVRFYMHQLLDALEYLSEKKVAVRDLKPDNILLDQDFNLKLIDFGFAVSGNEFNYQSSKVVGTETYLPPECFTTKSSLPKA